MLGHTKPENKKADNGKNSKKNINAKHDTNSQDRYIIPRGKVNTYIQKCINIRKQRRNIISNKR